MASITVEIPEGLAAHFDTDEAIRRALFEDFVIEQRLRGVISLGKAAELLALTQRHPYWRWTNPAWPARISLRNSRGIE